VERKPGFRTLGSVLSGALADIGLGNPAEAALHARWADAVGPAIAAVSRVERLEGGRLTIGVDHPTWNYELMMRAAALKDQVNAFLHSTLITDVHVKLRTPRGR